MKKYQPILVGLAVLVTAAACGAAGAPIAEKYVDLLFGMAIGGGVAGYVGVQTATAAAARELDRKYPASDAEFEQVIGE